MLPKIKNIIKKNENPYLFNFADICLIFPILTLIFIYFIYNNQNL